MNRIKRRISEKLGEEKTAKLKKAWNVARIIKNIIGWIMIVVLVFIVISFLMERINGGSPSIFGYRIYRVETASMDPTLKVGDVILSKEISNVNDIKKGDIITFQGDERFSHHRVTHRVFTEPFINDKGELVVVTKGDANEITDGEIYVSDIQTKMQNKLVVLTNLYGFFYSQWGLIVFIAFLILIFFDEVMNLIHLSVGKYDDSKEENISEIIERIQREDAEKLAVERRERAKLEDYGEDSFDQMSEPQDMEDPDPDEVEDEDE